MNKVKKSDLITVIVIIAVLIMTAIGVVSLLDINVSAAGNSVNNENKESSSSMDSGSGETTETECPGCGGTEWEENYEERYDSSGNLRHGRKCANGCEYMLSHYPVDEDEDGVCDECDLTVSSSGGDTGCDHEAYSYDRDDSQHWKVCSMTGCGEKFDYENHAYVNGACECGATRSDSGDSGSGSETGCDHEAYSYDRDDSQHWKVCSMTGCGEKFDYENHAYVNGTCECGATRSDSGDSGSGSETGCDHEAYSYDRDDSQHWKVCSITGCGEKFDYENHAYVNGICECGATRSEGGETPTGACPGCGQNAWSSDFRRCQNQQTGEVFHAKICTNCAVNNTIYYIEDGKHSFDNSNQNGYCAYTGCGLPCHDCYGVGPDTGTCSTCMLSANSTGNCPGCGQDAWDSNYMAVQITATGEWIHARKCTNCTKIYITQEGKHKYDNSNGNGRCAYTGCNLVCHDCKGNPTSGTCQTCGMQAGGCKNCGHNAWSTEYYKVQSGSTGEWFHARICTNCSTDTTAYITEDGKHTFDSSNQNGKCAYTGCGLSCDECSGNGPATGTCATCGLIAGVCSNCGQNSWSTDFKALINTETGEKFHARICTNCSTDTTPYYTEDGKHTFDSSNQNGKCAYTGCGLTCLDCGGYGPSTGTCPTCGVAAGTIGACPGCNEYAWSDNFKIGTDSETGVTVHARICENCQQYAVEMHSFKQLDTKTGKCGYVGTIGECGLTCHECSGNGPETGTCSTCGLVAQGCSHSSWEWQSDSNQHWKKCLATNCGTEFDYGAHAFENGQCTVCSYTCTHSETYMDFDNAGHWEVCADCTKVLSNATNHNLEYTTLGQTQHSYSCTDCNYANQVEAHNWNSSTGICSNCNHECAHIEVIGTTCSNCGKTIESTHTHVYVCSGTGANHIASCTGCTVVLTRNDLEEIMPDKPATCTEPGASGYTRCRLCQETITPGATIPALGHKVTTGNDNGNGTHTGNCTTCGTPVSENHEEVIDQRVEATCTMPGKTQGSHCSECNAVIIAQTEIPATGHTVTNWTDSQNGMHTGNCTTCGTALLENHIEVIDSRIEPTCTTPGKTQGSHCSKCNAVIVAQAEIPATGHTVTSWTDNQDGTHTGNCTVCGETETKECSFGTDNVCTQCGAVQDIECAHDYQIDKEGATETEHWEKCTKCSYRRNITRHTFENGVCTICEYQCSHNNITTKKDTTHHWEECDNCGGEVAGTREEHEYTNGECECGATCMHINMADKQDNTYHWKECNDCGTIIDKEEHSYTNGSCECGKAEPECTHTNTTNKQDDTYHWKECNNCGTIIEKEEHSYTNGSCECGKAEPECTHRNTTNKQDNTYHWKECNDCGTIIDKEEHSYTNGSCECGKAEPECTHTNTTIKHDNTYHWKECNSCGAKIDKEEHSYADGKCECGKVCTHTNTTDKKDETYHWKECNNCGKVIEKEKHNYNNGKCECGKTEAKCTHEKTTQKSNDVYHWDECDKCGLTLNQEKHTYKDGKCSCGLSCKHSNKEWKADENEHWQECKECGKEIENTREKHNYADGKCKNCGTKDSDNKSGTKLPDTGTTATIIIIGIAGVALVASVIGIKKYKGV